MCAQVPNKFISRLDLIPNIDAQTLRVTVQGNQPALGLPVFVAAMQDGKQVCSLACIAHPAVSTLSLLSSAAAVLVLILHCCHLGCSQEDFS